MKSLSTKAALMLLVALVWCSAAQAAGVLDQVPSDAWVVVKVNHLQQTSDKIAKWAEQLGLAQMVPQFADPIGTLEKELKITQGLDATGEMALVLVNPDLAGGDNDKSMLILLPAKDFKAVTANFKNFKAGAGGSVGSFKDENGMDIFVAQWGNYAAFSPSQQLVAKKPAATLKLTGVIAKEMTDKDVTIFANIPAMKGKVLPELKDARKKALDAVEQGNPSGLGLPGVSARADALNNLGGDVILAADVKKKAPAGAAGGGAGGGDADQFKPVGKAVVNLLFDGVEHFMNESTGTTFSINLTDDGLNTSLMADFTKDSTFGTFVAGLKNTDADLLKGLPTRKYFAYGGAAWNSDVMSKAMSSMLDPIIKSLADTNAGGKQIGEMIANMQKGMAAIKSMTIGYTAPTGALGADSIIQVVEVVHGDSKVIADVQKKNFEFTSNLFKNLPAAGPGVKADMEIKEGDKTVAGVKLDSFKMNMTMDENDPAAAQFQQGMAFMYGPNGFSGYMGAVDPNTFIVVSGGTDKLLTDAVNAAKNPIDPFAKMTNVQAVSKQLPANRIAVGYLDLAQIVSTGVRYAQSMNLPIKLQLPANLPPIGMAVANDGTALRVDTHVPTALVQSVVAAGMQTYMQMQGGGGNAGNPDGL